MAILRYSHASPRRRNAKRTAPDLEKIQRDYRWLRGAALTYSDLEKIQRDCRWLRVAALTYARRYALFTLMGIAGQDDVDALTL